MFFSKNKRSGSIMTIIFLLVLLSWISTVTCFLLKKEYEKCFVLVREKKITDNEIISECYKNYLDKRKG